MDLSYKVCRAPAIKMTSEGSGTVSGYASTFDNWDDMGERPVRGAFLNTLKDFLQSGFIAAGHEWDGYRPLCTLQDAHEDAIGLWVSGEFHSTQYAQDARLTAAERLDRGKTVSFSIGYQVLDSETTQAGRLLKELKLYEVSLVNVPANSMARVAAVKGGSALRPPYDVEAGSVETAIRTFLKRTQARQIARQKDGRVLSAANRSKLANLETSLADLLAIVQELLAASEPPEKAAIAMRRAQMDFLRLQASARVLLAGDLRR